MIAASRAVFRRDRFTHRISPLMIPQIKGKKENTFSSSPNFSSLSFNMPCSFHQCCVFHTRHALSTRFAASFLSGLSLHSIRWNLISVYFISLGLLSQSTKQEENEDVVQKVLASCPDFELVEALPSWSHRGLPLFPKATYCLRCSSETDMTHGFFVAVFQRKMAPCLPSITASASSAAAAASEFPNPRSALQNADASSIQPSVRTAAASSVPKVSLKRKSVLDANSPAASAGEHGEALPVASSASSASSAPSSSKVTNSRPRGKRVKLSHSFRKK